MFSLESLVAVFAPHHCLACGAEGALLCAACRDVSQPHPEICYRCHKLSTGYRTCSNCRKHSPLRSLFIATKYEGPVEAVIRALKFGRAASASQPLARLVNDSFRQVGFDLVCAVPSASRRQLRRGYNPAELIAAQVSRSMNLPHHQLLGRLGQHRQVGASRQQRLEQLQGAFYVRNSRLIAGKRVLIFDDVVTTGATLTECAKALKAGGAKSIDAAVVARNNN